MKKSGDELSTLFRSLRPDDKDLHASVPTAAHEAEQRWPILGGIAPRKPSATPALSAQEKQRWISLETSAATERKSVLSLPGLGDKLTKSLGQMSARRSAADLNRVAEPKSVETPSPENALPHSRLPDTKPAKPDRNLPSLGAIFSSKTQSSEANVQMPLSAPEPNRPAPQDDSLAAVFNRLKRSHEPVDEPSPKRASFLSHLGRK